MSTNLLLSPESIKNLQPSIFSGDTPLWKYWEAFRTRYLESGRSEVTISNVRDALKFAINKLHLLSIEEVNNSVILENSLFEYKNSNGISDVTYNTYLKNINTYFIWLSKHGHIEKNNLPNVMRCKEQINEQYTLNEDQINILTAHVHKRRQTRLQRSRNAFFIDILFFTGARPCEILNIQVKDIIQNARTYEIIIRGKKQKGRIRHYPLPSSLRDSYEIYEHYRSEYVENEPYLFVSTSKKARWTHKGMRGLFKALSKELGFKITAYSFRRCVATKLYQAGLPLEKIAQYLGHTRTTTTLRYVERSCNINKECAAVMER